MEAEHDVNDERADHGRPATAPPLAVIPDEVIDASSGPVDAEPPPLLDLMLGCVIDRRVALDPADLAAVDRLEPVFICMSTSGTMTRPIASPSPGLVACIICGRTGTPVGTAAPLRSKTNCDVELQ